MLRSKKTVVIEEMGKVCHENSCFIVAKYQGLTVAQLTSLRKSLKKDGANFRIVKNSLSRIAVSKSNKIGFDDILSGPVGIAYANDPIVVSKKLVDFTKKNSKLQIIGGVIDGQFYSDKQIVELSKLPSMDQIRSGIVGVISGVASSIARVVQAPGTNVARVIFAYSSEKGE